MYDNDELNNYDPSATMAAVEKAKNELAHYGTPRHSGRYPWGSGDHPYQRNADFLGHVEKLRKQGLSEKEIAYGMNLKTSELRYKIKAAKNENRAYEVAEMYRLYDKGMSRSAVARRMGIPESTLRGYEKEEVARRINRSSSNAEILKKALAENGYGIDIGAGIEHYMGTTKHTLNAAVNALKAEGYKVLDVKVEQLGTGKVTTVKTLCPPGTKWSDIQKNRDKIKPPVDIYTEDGGTTFRKIEPPVSIDPKRVMVRYAEDGGKDMDGVIELRRGVEDISMKDAKYCQVRIEVGGTHYLKGMAVYADDLPDGVDIRFNTNKTKDVPMINKEKPDKSVLKPLKNDPENPFGANTKQWDDQMIRAQRHYIGEDGKEHLSALNIIREEGEWSKWTKTLASQFLSKQKPALAKQQLDVTYKINEDEFKEIMAYDNPTVRRDLLEDFARRVDHDAVHLAAASLPRQATKVLLPLTNTSDTECYCPGFQDGDQVALVRYPHGGIFEIPILTVNNNNPEAKRVFGDAIDAIGINPTVAARLSGADFDGDTVLVLPNNDGRIKGTANKRPVGYKPLEGFDPKERYPGYPGMHVMTDAEKGLEMGKITNLITDMTIKGATPDEICRADMQSMVVIDAQKHKLNYKQSEQDFRINELRLKYQGKEDGGASTLISRSTSEEHIPSRKEKAPSKMSPEEYQRWKNGEMIYVYAGKDGEKKTQRVFDPNRRLMSKEQKEIWDHGTNAEKRALRKQLFEEGKMVEKYKETTEISTKGAEYSPYQLVSRNEEGQTTRIEAIYAKYAADMKELAKKARSAARNQEDVKYNPEAYQEYKEEVESLKRKVALAERNAPLERQAQLIANKKFAAIKYNNPDMDDEHLKREKNRQLDYARRLVGAKKKTVGSSDNPLTDKEWEAISKGAVHPSFLKRLLTNADKTRIKELTSPNSRRGLPAAKLARARNLLNLGYTRADICDMLEISESTLIKEIGLANL